MNKTRCSLFFIIFSFLTPLVLHAQLPPAEPVDSATVERIIQEGTGNSQVMQILTDVTEVHGPRLSWSREFRKAAEWARQKLTDLGLQNARLESWEPMGRGWTLNRHTAHVVEPLTFPIISYPKAWSPGTEGTLTAEAVYFDAQTDSALETFKGKLKGKFVLLSSPRELKAAFTPQALRHTPEQLLDLANADIQRRRRRSIDSYRAVREREEFDYRKLKMCYDEGAAVLVSGSRGDGGNIFVQAAGALNKPGTRRSERARVWAVDAPHILPQVEVAAEHYNRIVRMVEKGMTVKIEMNMTVLFTPPDSGYNVIAELPGTDLADEVVMIGGHLDSWHGGTGTTDNGTGVASCIEAMRILKALDIKPRRTIRIALWGGEEQGLFGSRAYVKRHFAERTIMPEDSSMTVTMKPAGEKFSVYFNHDNGTGRFRGIYMHGNEGVRHIFRSWFEPFDMQASTLSLSTNGSSDHIPFDEVGLPAFEFIQDDIEYFTRTWHSTMDLYDRAQKDDLIQTATILATFAYNAAMRDGRFPRKSIPARDTTSSQ